MNNFFLILETQLKIKNIKKEILNKTPIDIDLAPNRDKVYSGIGLKSNDDIFIFLCFNDELKEFDGFAIVRNFEIEKYREWDEEELKEIRNNNSTDFFDKLPIENMNNFYTCIFELKEKELIAIFIESDDENYFVGKIKQLTQSEVKLKLITSGGEWIEEETISLNEITYIGFDSSYENELIKNKV